MVSLGLCQGLLHRGGIEHEVGGATGGSGDDPSSRYFLVKPGRRPLLWAVGALQDRRDPAGLVRAGFFQDITLKPHRSTLRQEDAPTQFPAGERQTAAWFVQARGVGFRKQMARQGHGLFP